MKKLNIWMKQSMLVAVLVNEARDGESAAWFQPRESLGKRCKGFLKSRSFSSNTNQATEIINLSEFFAFFKQMLQPRVIGGSLSSLSFGPMAYSSLQPPQQGLVHPGIGSASDILRRTINSQLTPLPLGFKEPPQVGLNFLSNFLFNFFYFRNCSKH